MSEANDRFCHIEITRIGTGIRVQVQTTPAFEALMKSWGAGESINVSELGREWRQVGDQKLKVWHTNQHTGVHTYPGGYYRLDKVGTRLFEDSGDFSGGIINITWLRLVGIGEPGGVAFEVPGAYSLEYLRSVLKKMSEASKKVYTDFLLPINLTVTLLTQEAR